MDIRTTSNQLLNVMKKKQMTFDLPVLRAWTTYRWSVHTNRKKV